MKDATDQSSHDEDERDLPSVQAVQDHVHVLGGNPQGAAEGGAPPGGRGASLPPRPRLKKELGVQSSEFRRPARTPWRVPRLEEAEGPEETGRVGRVQRGATRGGGRWSVPHEGGVRDGGVDVGVGDDVGVGRVEDGVRDDDGHGVQRRAVRGQSAQERRSC